MVRGIQGVSGSNYQAHGPSGIPADQSQAMQKTLNEVFNQFYSINTKGSKSGAEDCLNSLQSKVDALFKHGNIDNKTKNAMTDQIRSMYQAVDTMGTPQCNQTQKDAFSNSYGEFLKNLENN